MRTKLRVVAAVLFAATVPCTVFANEAHNRIAKMPSSTRNIVFTAFLSKSGEDCDLVTRNFYQGSDKDDNAYWDVACQNKASYVITINNDAVGSTKILSCAMLKAVNAGQCFKKFKK